MNIVGLYSCPSCGRMRALPPGTKIAACQDCLRGIMQRIQPVVAGSVLDDELIAAEEEEARIAVQFEVRDP